MEFITDPRIREIMSKLNKDQALPEEPKEEEVKEPAAPKPPKTFEEFLKAEHLNEWPQRITSENLLDLQEERDLLGTKDDIVEQLRQAVPTSTKMLEDLEFRLQDFEKRLTVYTGQILTDQQGKTSRLDERLFHSPARTFMTEMSESDAVKSHHSRKSRKKMDFAESVKETKKQSVDCCKFPGFRPGELTELPGQLESPHILHRVTKAQDFNPGFKKFWKKIFQSEASVAIMQDAFWWFFIENFERESKKDQDKLFDRIADSFVALFTSINPEIKDKFFEVYCDCLGQAVFAAFHEAFPESTRHFQDDFKQHLVNLLYEWVTGTRPPPHTYKKWKLHRLEPKVVTNKEDTQTEAAKSLMQAAAMNKNISYSLDMDDFHRTIQKLGEPSNSRVQTVATEAATPGLSRELTRFTTATAATGLTNLSVPTKESLSLSRQAQCGTPRRQPVESHQIGPGPELERVKFNIHGRSPLVAHYLHMKQLRDNQQPGRRVRRTEIAKIQPEGPTYRELINDTMAMSETLSKEYQRICELTRQEILKIERQNRDMNREVEKLSKEVMHCRNSTELKQLSERIMEKRETSRLAIADKPYVQIMEDEEYSDEDDY